MRRLACVTLAAIVLTTASVPVQARDGGAIAAGIIGGLALGGLAAAAAGPAYGYPAYGYAPYGYYRPRYYRAAGNCWRERRRATDDYGNIYFRRVRVCG